MEAVLVRSHRGSSTSRSRCGRRTAGICSCTRIPIRHSSLSIGSCRSTAAGRLAYVNSHADMNLRSAAVDPATGISRGPLRRMTRGPGILQHLSVTADGGTLTYFTVRLGKGDVFRRDLETGSETVVDAGGAGKGYPAISPSGRQLAYGVRMPGARATRPISVAGLNDGAARQLCDDCRG